MSLELLWAEWLRPSAGLPVVQWSMLLAAAALAGHVLQRHTGLPKVLGYSLVGALAGLAGFQGATWPLRGIGLFLLELGVAVVLFECGGRVALRWFRHNPWVLAQAVLAAALTWLGVYQVLLWAGMRPESAEMLAIVALVASPAVLTQVAVESRASGPVTERARTLATLSALLALAWGAARAGLMVRPQQVWFETLQPVMVIVGLSFVVGAVLALALRSALRLMSPTSENTAVLLLSLVAAASAVAAHVGGSAPLAALLAGLLLKQIHPRPWSWPRQLGTASGMLTMLMFVLVSVVAASMPPDAAIVPLVLMFVAVRAAGLLAGCWLARGRSGLSLRQAALVGLAMLPMSSVALLVMVEFMGRAPALMGLEAARVALPAILLMEVIGAVIAAWALREAGEGSPARKARASTEGADERS